MANIPLAVIYSYELVGEVISYLKSFGDFNLRYSGSVGYEVCCDSLDYDLLKELLVQEYQDNKKIEILLK